jgi:hypothetical protein
MRFSISQILFVTFILALLLGVFHNPLARACEVFDAGEFFCGFGAAFYTVITWFGEGAVEPDYLRDGSYMAGNLVGMIVIAVSSVALLMGFVAFTVWGMMKLAPKKDEPRDWQI